MKNYLTEIVLGISLCSIMAVGLINQENALPPKEDLISQPLPTPEYKFGFDISNHWFEDYKIKRGDFLGDILMSYGISFERIIQLEKKAEDVFSLRKLMAGKDITFIRDDECADPKYFVYKPNIFNYVVYNLEGDNEASMVDIPFETCIQSTSGTIETSLWDAMTELGLGIEITDKMEDALAQVNFFACQKGDQFKLVYERKFIGEEPVGIGKILSAAYKSGSVEDYSFYYENEKYDGYYDFNGRPTQKSFRRAPVRISRISSRFNPNRFHPILKRRRAHLGTDYAAPRGTPILAVADGVISKKSYTKGNGNYIKIRHDKVYESQYLHMNGFAKGIRPGVKVKRDQVIGYVGSTGLATGPHVCFRFWKNGRQINHLRENFPPLDPMPEESLPAYFDNRDNHLELLNAVDYEGERVLYAGFAGT